MGFSSQSAFAIKLALEEALNNAIRHGNGMDHSKKIHIEAKITPTRIEIVVEDEGVGFNRDVVPGPDTGREPGKMQRQGDSADRSLHERSPLDPRRPAAAHGETQ